MGHSLCLQHTPVSGCQERNFEAKLQLADLDGSGQSLQRGAPAALAVSCNVLCFHQHVLPACGFAILTVLLQSLPTDGLDTINTKKHLLFLLVGGAGMP